MNPDLLKKRKNQCFKVYFVLPMAAVILLSMVFSACTPQIKSSKKAMSDPVLPLENLTAKAFQKKGMKDYKKGAFESAIKNWIKSEKLYKDNGKIQKQCVVMVELSRAYQTLGLSNKALEVLDSALILAEESGKKSLTSSVLAHLGNIHTIMGNKNLAEDYLNRSLLFSNLLDDPEVKKAYLGA